MNGIQERTGSSAFARVAKYILVRGVILFATIAASVFLIIYIANLGGYLDTIQEGQINEAIGGMIQGGWLKGVSEPERTQKINETIEAMEAYYGLDKPYALRVMNWFVRGITLDWGQSRRPYIISSVYVNGYHTKDITTTDIRTEIFAYLPRTLLLLGLSNLVLFVFSVFLGMFLIRRPGNWLDRLLVALAPVSAAPSWMFGLVLIIIFYRYLHVYTFNMGVTGWRTTITPDFALSLIRGLFLPFLAIFLSKSFQSIYSWRAYFLTFSNESYIELAKAKGLPPRVLERRYLLRPALPNIITTFALIMITIWQECIAVEYFFNVGGIGSFFVTALNSNEISIIVALVSVFAYMLAFTVFSLDIIYALVDPRIRVENERESERPYQRQRFLKDSIQSLTSFFFIRRQAEHKRHSAEQNFSRIQISLGERFKIFRQNLAGTYHSFMVFIKELTRYRSATVGIVLIIILLIISAGTVIAIPYNKAISLWRGDNKVWIHNPIEAPPAWINFFRTQKLPENIQVNSLDSPVSKEFSTSSSGNKMVNISIPFDYEYDTFPQDILVLFNPVYKTAQPFAILTWVTPDGREIPLANFTVSTDKMMLFNSDRGFAQKYSNPSLLQVLFGKPGGSPGEAQKGEYALNISGYMFEANGDLNAELTIIGQVHGLAGTDRYRRDLTLVLLWGTVVALCFGILAAIGTTLSSVFLAATSAWFGGWVDGLIQRISEINMTLPVLPISIMIFYMYSKSFWVILGVTVALSIFGVSIKNYRAMFLQIKSAPYVEGARTYGASNWRIIIQYLIPRVRSVLIPQLIILVPSYIFFEATLSFLGVSDPLLPTLGKLLVTSLASGLAMRPIYLLIEPVLMLVIIALGFALPGFALERLFNEKIGV